MKLNGKIIPPNSFVIFKTKDPLKLTDALSKVKYFRDNNITGIIIMDDVEIAAYSDEELEAYGLKRIPVDFGEAGHEVH